MLAIITGQGLPSPFRSSEISAIGHETDFKDDLIQEEDMTDHSAKETSKLIIMQFTVQHLALEVSFAIICKLKNKSV